MWTPIDVDALPTAKDVLDAERAIEEVEKQLQEALKSLEQAKIRVADLESDLQRRRARVAPIRRLNFDVLCRIFEVAGEDSWKAPIRLAGVSRSWRFIALSIPHAWSFLDLEQMKNPKLVDLYLERSERLQCLSICKLPHRPEDFVFPQVTKLYIRITDHLIYPTFVTRKYFPGLKHLHCHSRFTRERGHRLEDDTDWTYDLPLLETVDLRACSDTTWACLLRNCSKTVTSLRLVFNGVLKRFQQHYSITMPLLKCLEISGRMMYVQAWPLNLTIPALESYISYEWDSATENPIHSDLETVKQMRLSRAQPLMNYTGLRFLQILNVKLGLYPNLTMLEEDMALCPRLEVIVVVVEAGIPLDDMEFTRRIERVSKGRTGLKVLRQEVILEKFKGEINFSCREGMPCN